MLIRETLVSEVHYSPVPLPILVSSQQKCKCHVAQDVVINRDSLDTVQDVTGVLASQDVTSLDTVQDVTGVLASQDVTSLDTVQDDVTGAVQKIHHDHLNGRVSSERRERTTYDVQKESERQRRLKITGYLKCNPYGGFVHS